MIVIRASNTGENVIFVIRATYTFISVIDVIDVIAVTERGADGAVGRGLPTGGAGGAGLQIENT